MSKLAKKKEIKNEEVLATYRQPTTPLTEYAELFRCGLNHDTADPINSNEKAKNRTKTKKRKKKQEQIAKALQRISRRNEI